MTWRAISARPKFLGRKGVKALPCGLTVAYISGGAPHGVLTVCSYEWYTCMILLPQPRDCSLILVVHLYYTAAAAALPPDCLLVVHLCTTAAVAAAVTAAAAAATAALRATTAAAPETAL
jgi:hypothetical protein